MFHKEARQLISERIVAIKQGWDLNLSIDENLDKWDFETRSKTHPDECPCYKTSNPCHGLEHFSVDNGKFSCFLCLCPKYDMSREEGGCLRSSPDAYGYVGTKSNGVEEIWDCDGCPYPHERDVIRAYLKKILFHGEF